MGANNRKTFQKVTFPLSLKGVASGVIMVFLPCATGFTIPEIMSGGNMILIGTIIEQKFKQGVSYNVGSLISIVIILICFLHFLDKSIFAYHLKLYRLLYTNIQ